MATAAPADGLEERGRNAAARLAGAVDAILGTHNPNNRIMSR